MLLARVVVEIEELGAGQARLSTGPNALEAALDRSRQIWPRVDEDVIAAAVAVAIQEQAGLIHTVNDTLGWDAIHRSAQAGKGREEVSLVNDVPDRLPGLDHTGPVGYSRHAYAAFPE